MVGVESQRPALADRVPFENRSLTLAQFGDLAEVPPELEWLANITNVETRQRRL